MHIQETGQNQSMMDEGVICTPDMESFHKLMSHILRERICQVKFCQIKILRADNTF